MLLTRAEDAFRDLKTPLAERPIFHQLEKRVDMHIFLCVIAYRLFVAIEKTLLDKKVHPSWGTVREGLTTHLVTTVALPTSTGEVLKIRKGSRLPGFFTTPRSPKSSSPPEGPAT